MLIAAESSAQIPRPTDAPKPLYERIGGLQGITVVVDDFIDHLVVNKALNKRTGATKATKGRRNRTVTIEPNILPLLATMKKEGGPERPLVPEMPSEREPSKRSAILSSGSGITT